MMPRLWLGRLGAVPGPNFGLRPILIVTPSGCRNPERFESLLANFEILLVENFDNENLSQALRERVVGIWLNFDTVAPRGLQSKYPSLEFVATTSTGIDHLNISLEETESFSLISLEPSKGELDNVTSTVELTWALILAQFVRVEAAHADVLNGHWTRSRWERGRQLSEQVLGVVGFGRIGQRVARVGASFGMSILVSEIHPQRQRAVEQSGYSLTNLKQLTKKSDWVSLHADARPENLELISGEVFEQASPFHLVNTARGSLVSEQSVIKALRSGKLLSYSADVLNSETRGEPHSDQAILKEALGSERVLLTPHIGGATVSAYEKTEEIIAAKILDRISKDA
jgi:D-3-phosphoglycerate dehydrogenase / 2-oxoglutarate reductase